MKTHSKNLSKTSTLKKRIQFLTGSDDVTNIPITKDLSRYGVYIVNLNGTPFAVDNKLWDALLQK